MLAATFRAVNAVFAVVVAVVVSTRWGESNRGKVIIVIITAGVVALCEWLMAWAPKHSAAARSLLDPRAVFIGVWMQQGVLVRGEEGTSTSR